MKIGGWTGTLTFRDKRRDSLLEGLYLTSQILVHLAIVSRSMFRFCAMTSGCFTIRYKHVSSDHHNGPNIEPFGTPA